MVVDVYSDWSGPCSAMTNFLKKVKLEVKYLKEVTPYFLKVVSRPHHLRNISNGNVSWKLSMFTASWLVSILMEYCSGNVALKHWLGGT